MTLTNNAVAGNMTTQQIGYAAMTVLIIAAFLLQALAFSFNNWYRMDIGPFVLRTGLWEMRIYDEANVTGLDATNHEKAEFRFYNPIWKSAMDRIDKMAKKPAPKKPKNKGKGKPKPTTPALERAPDGDLVAAEDIDNDPDFNEFEHFNFKPGENWFNLPQHIPDTVWDQVQGNLDGAEALYSMTWLATFLLMCLFAFHQFVPWFQVTIPVMQAFCAALFVTGFFALISVACYGNAMPKICEHITNAYKQSPNPKFADLARDSSDCSFSGGYHTSLLSGLALMITGVMAAVRICQLKRGENFDLGSAAGTAVNFGKTLIASGGISSAINRAAGAGAGAPAQQPAGFDWNQQASSTYSDGYDQGEYQAVGNAQQGEWERLQ